MSFLKPKTIEEIILYLIESGEKSTASLLAEVRQFRKRATKQAFYSALRKLKVEEAVVVYRGTVALHTTWINDMRSVVEKITETYTGQSEPFSMLSLTDKESVSYSFSTIRHLDSFWGHAQTMLIAHTPQNEAVYAYNPHYWFYIARANTERKLLKEIAKKKRQFLMTVARNAKLDSAIARDFKTDLLQYCMRKAFDTPNNYYVTAIGSYVIEVFLDKKLAGTIEKIYQKYEKITPEAVGEMESLLAIRARNKIKISRNKSKAEKIRKRLSKNFFVKD
jgi:hypothetical protein